MSATETSTTTMFEAAERFLADAKVDVEHGKLRQSTIKEYARLLDSVLNVETARGWKLGDKLYEEVGLVEVRAALYAFARKPGKPRAGLKRPDGTRRMSEPKRPSPSTVNGCKAALATMFREQDIAFAITRVLPTAGIRIRDLVGKANKPEKETRYLTVEEQAALVAALTPAHKTLVRLILATGMRSAEARGLTVDDLDLDAEVPLLRVTGQANEHGGRVEWTKSVTSAREIPLTPEAIAVIREQVAWVERVHGDASPYLFPTSTDPQRTATATNLWRSVQKATRKAGIEGRVSVHDLRHTFAKTHLHRGVSIDVISQVLGHSDVGVTTKIYLSSKVSNADKLAALMRHSSSDPSGEEPSPERSEDA